jgi:phosphate transport system substrate-binding protein
MFVRARNRRFPCSRPGAGHLLALWLTAASAAAGDLRVVGTDLLGIEASESIYAFAGRARLPLALAFDGSRPGLDVLRAGRADLALLVVPPGELPGLDGFESITLAYHCAVVLVPASVPLEEVTLGQLRDAFGESGANNLSRWGDFGIGGELAPSAIALHLPAAGQGIAVEFFRTAVLGERPFKSTVERYATPGELARRLAGDRRGLALAAVRPPAAPGIKLVRLAARAGEPAYSPTPENVHSGDYPLALPLRMVFRRAAARRLQPLLQFLLSNEFVPVLERAQVVPLAPAARRQQALRLK